MVTHKYIIPCSHCYLGYTDSDMIAMAYFMLSLGLLTILTLHVASGLTSFNCSDLQSSASGSHNTDLSQFTTLQYCIVDNCTIMRIDTGQQLGIVYTTEDLLLVTPVDGHTSMVIAKIDEDLPCPKIHNTTDDDETYVPLVVVGLALLIMIMVCPYILIFHLLIRKLRTLYKSTSSTTLS